MEVQLQLNKNFEF